MTNIPSVSITQIIDAVGGGGGQTRSIIDLTHPEYVDKSSDWSKFRAVYVGGKTFVDDYVKQFGKREFPEDFTARKAISYTPSHAKAAIIRIRNAIFVRMPDIKREGGPSSYSKAVMGQRGGVDRTGSRMSTFIGNAVLPELLALGKVGVMVDKPPMAQGSTKADSTVPYVYVYPAEDILNWSYGPDARLSTVLVRSHVESVDPTYGLVTEYVDQYVALRRFDGFITYQTYDTHGVPTGPAIVVDVPQIPFVIFEINDSLLRDVADHQIALTNLASADMAFAYMANFPLYTEQVDMMGVAMAIQRQTDAANSNESTTSGPRDTAPRMAAGVTQGRQYTKGVERPAWVHPSAEPLRASMEKQTRITEEINILVNLNLATLQPRRASAESKGMDERGLEAGLSYLGLELERGEAEIANIWALYESSKSVATITYPRTYEIKSDEDRRKEADELLAAIKSAPSMTHRKVLAKAHAELTVGHRVARETLDSIIREIDKAPVIAIDPTVLREDHEAGFVSTKTASVARGYPAGEVNIAKLDHAERLARIAAAQSPGPASDRLGPARGMIDEDDQGGDESEKESKKEKRDSQNADVSDTATKAVRGPADG